MKSSCIFLLVALFCFARGDPNPKEQDNYREKLLELYNWTKTEFKPYAFAFLNVTHQLGHKNTDDPRLFEGEEHAVIQSFVDKTNHILSNFDEAMKHVDSEDFIEKTMDAFRIASRFQWKEGLPESTVKHLESIKDEGFQQYSKEIDAVFQKPTKEFYDKFLARLDETIDKLTPSEREAHPKLLRWRETRKNLEWTQSLYFNKPWEFLFWAYDQLNGVERSEID